MKHSGAILADQAKIDPSRGQALVRIVRSQGQTVFGAGREHPIRLGDTARHQDHRSRPDIGFGPIKERIGFAAAIPDGIQTGDQALRAGLLISGGAIDLPGEKQSRHRFDLQSGIQSARIDIIIFDGIAIFEDLNLLETLYLANELVLDIARK